VRETSVYALRRDVIVTLRAMSFAASRCFTLHSRAALIQPALLILRCYELACYCSVVCPCYFCHVSSPTLPYSVLPALVAVPPSFPSFDENVYHHDPASIEDAWAVVEVRRKEEVKVVVAFLLCTGNGMVLSSANMMFEI